MAQTEQKQTGFVYDVQMEEHFCQWDPLHAETPERSKAIIKRLYDSVVNLTGMCHIIKARPARSDEIRLVHTEELMENVHHFCVGEPGKNDVNLKKFSELYNDVYINKETEKCALLAAGSTIELLDAIQRGTIRNGFAVVRPPGHHAWSAESNGFCIYNNVAIGAKYLMERHNVKRILIVDWDVHHGQGTQRIFFDDDSAHRDHWKGLQFQDYPNGKSSNNGVPTHTPHVVFIPPEVEIGNHPYGETVYYPAEQRVRWRDQIASLRKQYDFVRCNRFPMNVTCYAYHESMELHNKNLKDESNWDTWERIVRLRSRLEDRGLLSDCPKIQGKEIAYDELCLFHHSSYADILCEKYSPLTEVVQLNQSKDIPVRERWAKDVFVSPESGRAIRRAAGSLRAVTDEVLEGRATNAFAIIRPPGHHAHFSYPAGFCFANNVALTAKHLIENKGLQRVLIVDFDLHHGDGVQEAFYEDPRVLVISLHLAKHCGKDFYPFGEAKGVDFFGEGKGTGFNINVPWTKEDLTDGDYLSAFHQIIMPVAYEFAPEIVLVSCGFDAAEGDKHCHLSPWGYWAMIRMLMSLAGGKVVLALEGGYDYNVVEECGEAVMRALKGLPCQSRPTHPLVPCESAVKDVKSCLNVHQKFWKSLQYRVILSNSGEAAVGSSGTRSVNRRLPRSQPTKQRLRVSPRLVENRLSPPKKQRR